MYLLLNHITLPAINLTKEKKNNLIKSNTKSNTTPVELLAAAPHSRTTSPAVNKNNDKVIPTTNILKRVKDTSFDTCELNFTI